MLKTSHIVLFILTVTVLLTPTTLAYPINITDNFGCTVTIEKTPMRIVSLSPCNTEILFAVGAGDRVVAGTTYDTYPPEAVNLSKIGGFSSVNIEAVVNMSPDLVLAEHGNGEETINALKNLDLKVVSLNPKTMDDILENIRLVGNITGNDAAAESLTADMTQQIRDITYITEYIPDSRKPRVLYIVWHDPMYAAGAGSFPDDLIQMAGGKNIVEVVGWPVISIEDVVDKNPQIIICSGMGGGSYTIMEAITGNQVLAQTDAVKNNKVYPVDDPNTIELAGPRIVQGLAELHGFIAPDIQPAENVSPTQAAETQKGASPDNSNDTSDASSIPGFGMILALGMILMVYLKRER
ncbi:MAG: cobalamin-binding protein [ANME-2 cluster archaeon]|nr:cobalamin-binding protein [ANME-2 cluster archaeon]MBC2701212.1 cobalamin-binding protein [ANME-2 cluster archaeon]MBC2707125.1 cobalamin-binding protein [ANME-2 cluster archaeon]MBC2747549.1 cobalamin-binding protein [ANME-2 cluster archaeon]MBC2762859.1 cobalamin-binding protein [ANME-2 cluster archaeon]